MPSSMLPTLNEGLLGIMACIMNGLVWALLLQSAESPPMFGCATCIVWLRISEQRGNADKADVKLFSLTDTMRCAPGQLVILK